MGKKNESKIILLPLHLDGVAADSARYTESGKNPAAMRSVRRAYGIPDGCARLPVSRGGIPQKASPDDRRVSEILPLPAHEHVASDCGPRRRVSSQRWKSTLPERGSGERFRIVNNVYENRFDYISSRTFFSASQPFLRKTMLASIEAMACGDAYHRFARSRRPVCGKEARR